MKQQTVNEFKDGLNLDLHPLVTPKTVLTDNINGTFITYNGNEFCLQNDRGNKYVTSLTEGYIPIGIKEHNGILYIVSYSPSEDKTEIGTYPGVDWNVPIETACNLLYTDYKPLQNIKAQDPTFSTDAFDYDLSTPVTIEVQNSYDGSVNLILVADQKKTRIVNSGFSVIDDKQYKIPDRNQSVLTNYYKDVDKETELIRTSNKITNVDLLGVQSGGQFKGGNYTFYIKFGDADYNQTDVVAESGIVSIFNGNDGVPSTISGTLLDERTDKMIHLRIIGLNKVYSKIYIYYSREYSDTQGFRIIEYGMFSDPIDLTPDVENGIEKDYQSIWLTGFEQTTPIESELLNVDYHTVDWARTEAQHSNMLFLGNVGQEGTFKLYQDLDAFTKKFITTIHESTDSLIDTVSINYKQGKEYYSTHNIYNYIGYWPDEIYRFGIVYILKDGSTTPVFNMNGGEFEEDLLNNCWKLKDEEHSELWNKKGVFLTPKANVFNVRTEQVDQTSVDKQTINPIYFNFTLNENLPEKVKGWFVVRQKRIPRTICQGLGIGIEKKSHLPVLYNPKAKEVLKNQQTTYIPGWDIESFLSFDREMPDIDKYVEELEKLETRSKNWWKYLLLYSTLLPIAMTIARGGMIDSAVASGKLKEELKKYISAPLLKYINENHIYIPSEVYIAILKEEYYSEGTWTEVNTTMDSFVDTDTVDTTKFNTITDGITNIYGCEYNVYKFEYDESNNSWTYTYICDATYLSDDTTHYPDYLNIVFNDTSISAETVELTNDMTLDSFVDYLEASYDTSNTKSDRDKRIISITNSSNLLGRGLLSLDPCVKTEIAGMLDGSKFTIIPEFSTTADINNGFYKYSLNRVLNENSIDSKCVFIQSNTNVKVIDDYAFSTIAGSATSVNQYKELEDPYNVIRTKTNDNEYNYYPVSDYSDFVGDVWKINNINVVRGNYCPYIGVTNNSLTSNIYSIRLNETSTIDKLFKVREQDNSEYYCVSIRTDQNSLNVYRGDCYTNTITFRINRNFIDPTAPVAEQVVDEYTWAKNVLLKKSEFEEAMTQENATVNSVLWDNVNLTDVNTVDLGLWVTFKCLSSYNLGLRSKDTFHTDEMAILGSTRSFYPLNGASTATGNKMEESFLLNDGLSATVGRKRYNLMSDVPYSKSEFSNRIMFSNVNVTDSFTNGYRTFQGLSYKDYDKQYGAITKLISLGQNIFVVMEHGLGLVPVNPKALMQTTTGEVIHIYGYGVLPDEMTIISQDYGSKYEHSVIRTPIGIYGIDVDAKKIWRFSDKQGFETISDMKIETYLKDFLSSRQIEMGTSDIRIHYNGKKGDLMFAWYPKANENPAYMICYNERQNIWTTKYDWYPIVSENINDEFYSLNNEAIWDHAEDVGYNNTHVSSWYDNNHKFEFEFVVSDPIGVNKVFDNLQIISNNVQPNEMEITVIGDDYVFKRTPIDLTSGHKERGEYEDVLKIHTTSDIHGDLESTQTETEHSPKGYYHFDKRLNQSALTKWQPFKDMYKFGRRVGNIQYKDGSWFAQIEPILVTDEQLVAKEARIRDKWAKIRIRYSGKDLAVITAIKTLINI